MNEMEHLKSKISTIIKQLLREGRAVYLPNIGTLTPVLESASIDLKINKILPPKCKFVFSEKGEENGFLRERLVANNISNTAEVEDVLGQYSSSLFDDIYKNGFANIAGVGRINADGEKVSFEYATSLADNHYNRLKKLSIAPVRKFQPKPIQKVESKSFDWLPIVMGLILGLILLGGFYLFKNVNFVMNDVESNYIQPELVDGNVIPLDTIGHYTQDIDYLIDDEPKTITHNYVIVTGSLSKENNVKDMVKLLEELDYQVVTREHKALTRVGVLLSCDDIDINEYLDDIQSKISGDAWILEQES